LKKTVLAKKLPVFRAAALSAALLLAMTAFTGCSGGDTEGPEWKKQPAAEKTGVTLNVYNWGEYIDDEDYQVNEAFTHLTGIEVNYKTFDNNESMYALLSSGAADYDVIFPSDYMVGKMIAEDRLAKLNFDNIPNFQYIDDQFKNPVYDPDNAYSVPYTWGTVGIFYNTDMVDEADLQQGWDILWNEKYKGQILMFDNPRDAFGIALKKLGLSMNSENPDDWQAAYQELVRQKPQVQAYVMDQIFDKMANNEAALAPYYSGDGIVMMDENEKIDYFVPEEGTNRFVDAMCVLKNSPHQAEAEQYINFLCSTAVAKANAEYIGYSTPQTEARKDLDPEVGENPNFYPPESVLAKTEVFMTLPDSINELQDELWRQLKK
jgi:spermidine/putrescine transport system substrate-binding protein